MYSDSLHSTLESKNILLVTSMYPTPDPEYKASPICHFFAKQWKLLGYNVKVVHFCNALPVFYSWIGKLFGNYGMKRMWSVSFLKPNRKKAFYEIDGIPIIYVPIIHIIPHIGVSQHRRLKAYKYLRNILINENFIPDFVLSHWHSMAYFMPFFKNDFPNVITSVVIHNKLSYKRQFHSLFNSIDTWGFRSRSLQEAFESIYGRQQREFICLSGVPSNYVPENYPKKDFSHGINHFVFVGSLLKLKNVDITIKALNRCFKEENYIFDIVGDGPELDALQALTNDLKENRVVFHGRLTREKAQEIMNNAQVFIMVSSVEAFGLVYVEAMAKGCIPIATLGQGADGFVVDGDNGFLCKANDIEGLCSVIDEIRHFDSQHLAALSSTAYETAKSMTDEKVAENYLTNVCF